MNPLVQPDPGLYIWTIVTFLILVALLAKFAWRPLLEALEARQPSIRTSLDDARQAKQDLDTRARRVGEAAGRRRAPRPTRSCRGRALTPIASARS